jgi:FixJ family two-component response regulator
MGFTSNQSLVQLIDIRRQRLLLQIKEEFHVLAARVEGCSWQQIGDALGVSRQTVWLHWHEKDPTSQQEKPGQETPQRKLSGPAR